MAKVKNDINAQIFYALKVSEKSRVPFLFMSAPGMGKSTSVELFSKIRGYRLEILRGNSTSESEVMGYDVVDTTPGSRSTIHLRPSWYSKVLENDKNGQKTLLFLDEITTCPEHVQGALLHLIFERKVGDEKIPESTLIVSAGNYSQSLGNTFGLIPPLMNRFCIYNIVPKKDDVKTFLSRYDGALTGTMVDFYQSRADQLTEMDKKETILDEDSRRKVGEYLERGVHETTKLLMTTGEKVVDLKVTDMAGIYTDTDNDSTLKGFVTFRTLNYLRDVSMAAYECFGKDGISGNENYRNMIEGLCGLGLSRGKNNEVVNTNVTKDYFDSMNSVVIDIMKMKNTKLPEYEAFFNKLTENSKEILKSEEVNVIINKFSELQVDPELKTIDRPIDSAILDRLCEKIKISCKKVCNVNYQLERDGKILDVTTPEDIIGMITQWNSLSELTTKIESFVLVESKNYKDDIKNSVNSVISEIIKYKYKLTGIKKLLEAENAAIAKLVPELKANFIKKSA